MLLLKVLGALFALGLGLYLGLAGQYRPDPDELDRALGPGGRSRRVRRSFTPLGWLRQRQERPSHLRRRGSTRHFSLVSPESQEERDEKARKKINLRK